MRNSPTPEAPIAAAAWASDEIVDVGQQLDLHPVGGDRRLIAIRGELVLEIEKLALQLAIGAFDLRDRD